MQNTLWFRSAKNSKIDRFVEADDLNDLKFVALGLIQLPGTSIYLDIPSHMKTPKWYNDISINFKYTPSHAPV